MPILEYERSRCFDSVETYINKFGQPPIYSDGVPVNIGDTVKNDNDNNTSKSWKLGQIAGFYNNGVLYLGVIPESPNHDSSNLYGILPDRSGNWVRPEHLVFSGPAKLGETEDEEALIARILDEAKTEPKVALIDGKIFTLTLQSRAKSDEVMAALMRSVSTRISKVRADANQKVAAAEQEAKRVFAMPALSLEDIQNGMRLYKEQKASVIHYVVPLHYAPKFIGSETTEAPIKQISAEHIAKLEQDVLLDIQVRQTGTIYSVGTKKMDMTPFYHYHGNGSDCLGQIKLPNIKTTEDIWDLRDTYQKTLEIVNAGGALSSAPNDMPPLCDLTNNAKNKITDGWEIKPEVTPGVFCVGASVKVIGVQDGATELVGLIGKIVKANRDLWSVEFLAKYPRLHSCNGAAGQNRGWDFKESNLQVMPVGTRRTRVATEIETVETLSFATPEDEQFAKFGVRATRPIDFDLICARCGARQGEHHGDERVSICFDDRSDGIWLNSPYVRGIESSAAVVA